MSEEPVDRDNASARREFREFFEANYEALCAFCRRYPGQRVAAEDAAQAALAELWARWWSVPAKERRAWTFGVARNKVVDQVRRWELDHRAVTRLAGSLVADQPDSVAELVVVRSAIMALKPDQRDVALMLCAGLDAEEIATALHIKTSSARSLTSRVRRTLRKALEIQRRNARSTPTADAAIEGGWLA
ncbi:RNA polymerase sigma factor [Saccharothrix variisporea]|uniref:RNA polymerase sigma factor (Sigma-70 family) n=1 Tax=Saccharothrix variisporea TaxID=543527 RepID=A0A495XCQ0_9PSEU|nr:sigma-70 family RNA polymerase sigma factor [Saccharothrix variisporea]RKT70614.1 RNA polymerase sigma factor (sigma-70 family) [Saccharothrix variisporea]